MKRPGSVGSESAATCGALVLVPIESNNTDARAETGTKAGALLQAKPRKPDVEGASRRAESVGCWFLSLLVPRTHSTSLGRPNPPCPVCFGERATARRSDRPRRCQYCPERLAPPHLVFCAGCFAISACFVIIFSGMGHLSRIRHTTRPGSMRLAVLSSAALALLPAVALASYFVATASHL